MGRQTGQPAMIDALLAAVPTHGVWLVAAVTFLSCLALPMPASLVMLTAGGFAAAGDLDLWQVLGAALLGAVLGDQLGYWAARLGGAPMLVRLSHGKRRAAAQKGAQVRTCVCACPLYPQFEFTHCFQAP